eukprot:GEMP01006407.1.p1 GENE.GEMP01006407.1~~GEMP01006407.1.p1  ORF type:complete len:737 (+),score=204.09 GEMP01006407.1:138-2348(+)
MWLHKFAQKQANKSKPSAKHKSSKHALLATWLPNRPPREEVVRLGLLDRGEGFQQARRELEVFLIQRLHMLSQQVDEAPHGSASYSTEVIELLETQLDTLRTQLREADNEVKAARERVDMFLDERRLFVLGKQQSVLDTATKADDVARLLCDDDNQLKRVLDVVAPHIENVRAKLRRKQCLEAAYDMLEKTDKLRMEVFRSKLPWELIEELPRLCSKLPPGPLRDTSFHRVRFLINPLKDQLMSVLKKAIDGVWPLEQGALPGDGTKVMKAVDDLLRLQKVHDVVNDGHEERWIFEILAGKLVERFQYHFRRKESDANRWSNPEWAFKYVWTQLEDHGAALHKWQQESNCAQGADLEQGLATALAAELRYFLKDRWPHLIKPKEPDPALFLLTLYHLIELSADWRDKYPTSAPSLAADLEAREGVRQDLAAEELLVASLMRAVSADSDDATDAPPMFDEWVEVDFASLKTKFAELVDSGKAWDPSVEKEHPCVYVQTVTDALKQCERRQQFFFTTLSRQRYLTNVMDRGALLAKETLLKKWNNMNSPLDDDLRTAAIVLQGLTNILRTGILSRKAVQDIEQLRTLMVDKLVDDMLVPLAEALRSPRTGLGNTVRFFSLNLGALIAQMRQLFNDDAVQIIGRVLSNATANAVCAHVLSEVKFDVMEQVELCVTNCRDDVADAFDGLETKGFVRLWALVKILALPKEQALALRHDPTPQGAVSILDAMRILHSRPDLN